MVANNAIFEVSNDKVLVSMIRDGEIKKNVLTLEDFITSVKSIEQVMNTDYFCQNTVRYGSTANHVILTLFSPQCKIDLKARVNSDGIKNFDNLLFPSFLMDCHFDKSGRFIKSYIKMLPNKYTSVELDSSQSSYFMPFPNVYSDNKICWGSALNNVNINMTNANLLLDIFKSSVFNMDLFGEPLQIIKSKNTNITDVNSYYKFLTTIDEWPDSLCFNYGDSVEF